MAMIRYLILIIVFAGIVGGGYFVLNPSAIESGQGTTASVREFVIDASESGVEKKEFKGFEGEVNTAGTVKMSEAQLQALEEQRNAEKKNRAPTLTKEEKEELRRLALEEQKRLAEEERLRKEAVGDGKWSDSPQIGSIFVCDTAFQSVSASYKNPPWIQAGSWYPNLKLLVDGNIVRTNGEVTVEDAGSTIVLRSNGLPLFGTGVFPISSSDDVYRYDKNPFQIDKKEHVFVLPKLPTIAEEPLCVEDGVVGISLAGAPIHRALSTKELDLAAHAILDRCGGRPDKDGSYYTYTAHNCTSDFVPEEDIASSTLVGYALDGFGIFDVIEDGKEVRNEDLDACHGHSHEVDWNGEVRDIYHYHATYEYPYTVGCYMGEISNQEG